ncbi:hypothetical protein SB8_05525 [Pseudomonas oryzihabitans]|nr:hypothetical protein SB8_05525 [Pseudomonas psychrotolerans]
MDVRQFDFLAAQPSADIKPRETFCGISKRALALLLVNALFWQPIWAQAEGIVVSNGNGARLDQAGNGVPIVNIATPGANGLSHNQFQDYNVDSRGVILNNVTDRTGNTQLGGIIVGNPNLKGTAAGVILNEVVGTSPSQLKGYTEVAGQAARVIVANPYGVTCNGCGFINTPRVTLTTGKPILDGNRLDRFQVDGGSVTIEGNGLNADNVDQFDIVTRSAKLNAELHARQLNIIAGRNDVAADSLAATPRAASPGDAPQLAIDSSALGGMYANTIRLVGTEAGVGVKLAGNLAASAGDIQLDANGQLTVAQAAASGNVVLKSQGIDAQGPVYAGGGINVQSGGDITVRQSVAARNAIVLSAAGQLTNGGIVEAGVNPDNSRNAAGDVTLQGAQLTNRGSVIASRTLTATTGGGLDNTGATLSGGNQVQLTAASVGNAQGRIQSRGGLSLQAATLDNTQGLVTSAGALSATLGQTSNGNGEISSQDRLTLQGQGLDNRQGKLIGTSGLDLTLNGNLDNRSGTLVSHDDLQARVSGTLDNRQQGNLQSAGSTTLSFGQLLNAQGVLTSAAALSLSGNQVNNDGGQLGSQGNLTATLGSLDQLNGQFISQGQLSLIADRLGNTGNSLIAGQNGVELRVTAVDNRGGEVSSQSGSVSLTGQSLLNNGSKVIAGNDLNMAVTTVDNSASGLLSAKQYLRLNGQSLNNSAGGVLNAGAGLQAILSGALDNALGKLLAQGGLTLGSASLDNRQGLVSSVGQQTLTVTGGAVQNDGGQLVTDSGLTLSSASLDNGTGTLSAKGAVSLTTGTLTNAQNGRLVGSDTFSVTAGNLNNAGRLASAKDLQIITASLTNSGELFSQAGLTLDLQHGSLTNASGGLITAPGTLVLKNLGDVRNAGELSSGQSFTLAATSLDNSGGKLISNASLTLRIARALANAKGNLSAAGLDIAAASLDNSAGVLTSHQDLQVTLAGDLLNGQGQLLSDGALGVNAANLDNRQGLVSSAGQQTLMLTGGALRNGNGQLVTDGGLTLSSGSLDNGAGTLSAKGAVTLTTGELSNDQHGILVSGGPLAITAQRLDNTTGLVSSGQALQLDLSGALDNTQGRLLGQSTLDLTATSLDNRQGRVSSVGQQTLTLTGAVQNDGGQLVTDSGLSLSSASLDNGVGTLSAKGAVSLSTTGAITNAQNGRLIGSDTFNVAAGSLTNAGRLASARDLQVSTASLINSGELFSQAGLTLDLQHGSLTNASGGLITAPGALVLKNLGDVRNAGELSSGQAFTLAATSLDNSGGKLISNASLTLRIARALTNAKGALSAAGLDIEAASLDNSAGVLTSHQDLKVTLAGDLLNGQGQLLSEGALGIAAANLDNRQGLVSSAGQQTLVVTNGKVQNDGGQLVADGGLTLSSASLDNGAGTLSGKGAVSLTTTGALNNAQGGRLIGSDTFSLNAGSLTNAGRLASAQGLQVTTGSLVNSGELFSQAGLTLDLQNGSLSNASGGLITAPGALLLRNLGTVRNAGELSSSQAFTLAATSLDNSGGKLISNASLTLRIARALTNAKGALSAFGLDIEAASLDNGAGVLTSHQYLRVKLAGDLLNGQGQLLSDGTLDINAANLDNRQGLVSSAGQQTLTVTNGKVQNQGGQLVTDGGLTLSSASLDNGAGTLSAKGAMSLTTGVLDNSQKGRLVGGDRLTVNAQRLDNTAGLISAAKGLQLTLSDGVSNGQGQLLSEGTLAITAANLDNRQGLISSAGQQTFTVSGGAVQNDGGQLVTDGGLSLSSASLDNGTGTLSAKGAVSLTTTGALSNAQGGQLVGSDQVSVTAGSFTNAGRLASAKDLQVTTANLTNSGELFSQAGVTLDLQNGSLTNASGGLITAPGALLLNNLGTVRNAGELSSGQAFTLAATSLDNSGGKLVSNASLTLRIARALANAKGTLSAAGLDLQAGSLANAGGTLVSRGSLSVTTSGLLDNSADGLLSAATTLDVTAGTLDNAGGSLLTQGAATLTTGQLDNTAKGLINSQAGLSLNADRLDSSNGGEVSAKSDLHLTLGELKQQGGRLIGESALVLDLGRSGGTGNLDNTGGLIASSGALGFAHLNQVTNTGGEISSAQSFDLIAQALNNSKGKLISQGLLKVQAGQLTNDGGLLSGWQGLTVTGGNLSNRQSGTLSSKAGDLTVALSGTLDNGDNGALVSQGALAVTAGNLNNTGGFLSSSGAQTLSVTGTLQNGTKGLIDAGTGLTVNAGQFSNAGGLTQAKQALSVSAGNLDNRGGTLNGQQTVTLDLLGALTNTNGAVLAQGDLLLKRATQVSNAQGRLNSGGLLTLLVGGLDNSNGGTLASQSDLSITASGQVSNGGDGLLASQGGALSVTAGGLDNSGGTLQSATGLTLATGSGTVGNVGGKLLAQNGDLSITAGNLDNRGGILASLQGAFSAGISGLLANGGQGQAGGTIQAQRLDLSAGTLSNYNGKLTALGGDALFQIGSLDNRNGSLYGKGLVRVRGGSFDNSGDNDGQVFGNQIDFSLSGALNNRLGIIESTSTLSLAAASLDNTNGRLRALGSGGTTLLNLGGTLDNTNGRLESANQNLQLNLGGLINANGSLLHVGNGTFGLGLPLLQNAGGSVVSNGTLTLSGNSWTNGSVLQVANLVVNVDNLTQTGSGQLLARNSFSGTGGNWTNDGLIASGGAFNLHLGGTYQGAGRLSSAGDFTLGAGQLLLDNPNARLNGSGTTNINIGGLLRNQARIAATGDFNLSAGQVDNQGTLGAAGNLSITTANLTNQNSSLIFSGGNMGLWVGDFTNRYADVYSLGDLSIARSGDGSWANSIVNRSGTLTSDGSLWLAASTIQNVHDILAVNNMGVYTGQITELPCGYGAGDCDGGKRNHVWQVLQRDKLEVTQASAASSITAGRNLTVNGGDLLNSSSTLAAGGSFTANVNNLYNQGVETGDTQTTRVFISERTRNAGAWYDTANDFNDRYWYQSSNYNAQDLSGLGAAMSKFIAMTESEQTAYRKTERLSTGDQSYAAVIQAGGAVNVRANNNIDNSVVRPGYTYVGGGRRTDTSAPGTAYATVVTLNPQLPANLAQQQVNPTTLPGFNLPTGQNGLFRLSGQQNSDTDVKVGSQAQWLTSSQVTVDNQIGAQNTTYTAGRTQDTSKALESSQVAAITPLQVQKHTNSPLANQVALDGVMSTQPTTQTLLSAQLAAPSTLTGKVALDKTPQTAKAMDATTSQQREATVAEGSLKDVSTQGVATPTVSVALPTTVGHDLPHRYLVETNPALTDLKQFLSSDYLLGNLAYNPDTSWKRLGDGLYEQRLVQQAIVARTGQRFIDGLTSDEAQFKYLMDNAIASKQALGLTVGVGLTAEQVAALTHDIVWMEDQVVNGQHVLVPVLYLAQANNRLAANGALIQGSDVTLIAGNDLNNAGTLKATNNLSATATNNLVNSGLIQAGDRLSLLAGDNLTNRAGGILSGRDVDLTTIRGDILNERTVTSHQSASGANSWREDFADSAARIEAANDLTVQAGRDFSNVGGVLSSGRDLSITAGRDVNLSSARTETGRSSGTQFNTSSITQLGSSTTAGQNLSIHAGRDLSATASTLSAGKDLDLSAKHDLTLSSAADESHSYSTSKKITSKEDHVSQQGTSLTAGGAVTLSADHNLKLVASSVTAGTEAYLYAGKDLDLLAATNSDDSFFSKTKKGSFGRKSSQMAESSSDLAVTSSISAGTKLTLSAGQDINTQGAQLSAKGLLSADAGRNINLDVAENSASNATATSKKGFFSGKANSASSSQTTVTSTTLNADSIKLTADNDINLRAAALRANNAVQMDAGRDITLGTAQESSSSSQASSSSKLTQHWTGSLTQTQKAQGSQEASTQAIGSSISAGSLNMHSGRDTTISGSTVVADKDIRIDAGRNLSIVSAQDSDASSSSGKNRKAGEIGTWWQGATGVVSTKQNSQENSTRQVGSQIASLGGNVSLSAGEHYTQTASQVVAPGGNIAIAAKQVDIQAGYDALSADHSASSNRTAVGGSVNIPLVNAVRDIQQMKDAAGKTKDPRLLALAAFNANMSAGEAVDSAQTLADGKLTGIKVSVNLSNSQSKNQSHQSGQNVVGSSIAAGGDVTITAKGAGQDSHINIVGSDVNAGRDAKLTADGDINLVSAQNTSQQNGSNSNSGWSAGVGFSVGQQNGFTVDLAANKGWGASQGHSVTQTNTHITAGNSVQLVSGNDTNIRGGVVSGNQVRADVGGNLNLASLQDSNDYQSKQQNASMGVSICIPPFCYGASGSASASQQKINSTYASVTEQSGIKAGDGGFQVSVKGNTDLAGAVIASTDKAVQDGKNSLSTGSLTTSDIKNEARYDGSSVTLSGGYQTGDQGSTVGRGADGNAQAGAPGNPLPNKGGFSATSPIALSTSGNASSTTYSGISGATITITDPDKQKVLTGQTPEQVVTSINHDVSSEHDGSNKLKPIFNAEEVQAGFEITGKFVQNVGSYLDQKARDADAAQKQYKDLLNTANDPNNNLTDEQRQQYRDQALAYRDQARAIDNDWGAGGTYRQIATALVAAASGNISASNAEFVQNMLVNYIQQQGSGYIGKLVKEGELTEGSPLHAALHAIVGCAGAAASSQSCSAGALGGSASSLLAGLFNQADPNETREQREAKRNLITSLVTGIAAMSDGQGAATANSAATANVDNNWLATQQKVQRDKELAEAKNPVEYLKTLGKWETISTTQDLVTTGGIGAGLVTGGLNDAAGMVEFMKDPMGGLNGLYAAVSDPKVRAQIGEEAVQSIQASIDRMQYALQVGGNDQAFQLGKDLGQLIYTVGSVVSGVGGVAKAGVALGRVGIEVSSKTLGRLAAKSAPDVLDEISGLENATQKIINDAPPVISPTYRELRGANKGFQAHHILPQYLGRMLGYTTEEMMDQPATLITQYAHTGKLNPENMHKAISKYLPVMEGGQKMVYTAEEIRNGLQKAYTDIGRPELFEAINKLIK